MIDSQSVRSAGAPAAGPESTVQVPGKTLGKDDFLRLLVTQLQNQNPLNPLDQNQFLSQTAQFTALEELQNIGKALEEMKQSGSVSSLAQAAALFAAVDGCCQMSPRHAAQSRAISQIFVDGQFGI